MKKKFQCDGDDDVLLKRETTPLAGTGLQRGCWVVLVLIAFGIVSFVVPTGRMLKKW